jgi:hypothetical protein
MKQRINILFLGIFIILNMGCEKLIIDENKEHNNLEDFEMAWQITHDQYPYFEWKGIDWQEVYDIYYPKAVASQGDEIYNVLLEMFAHLEDGHMHIETEGGQQMMPWIPPRRIKDLYALNSTLIGNYFNLDLLVDSEGIMNYQVLSENIGYLNIVTFEGKYNFNAVEEIFNYFKNTRGMIIDIRHNYGGDIHNVDKVVGHFLTNPIPRNPYYFQGEQIALDSIRPMGSFTYSKPSVLLINGVSFSASEITSVIMKQINHVTVIGDTTGGGSLGYLNKKYNGDFRLPSGKLFHIGNLDVRNYDGVPFETIGVVPDILVPQTENDIKAGHDLQLEYAINFLKEKTL